jgi:hypothetical protein
MNSKFQSFFHLRNDLLGLGGRSCIWHGFNRDYHKSVLLRMLMGDEFTQWGMTIPGLANMYGCILIFWGLFSYFAQTPPEGADPSITAMIPAFMGLPLLLMGVLSKFNEANRHHYMHASMAVALIMFLAGASRMLTSFSEMSNLVLVSHMLLVLVGGSFVFAGIKSFRHARLNRES